MILIVVLNELYMFIPPSFTLTAFQFSGSHSQSHSAMKLKVLDERQMGLDPFAVLHNTVCNYIYVYMYLDSPAISAFISDCGCSSQTGYYTQCPKHSVPCQTYSRAAIWWWCVSGVHHIFSCQGKSVILVVPVRLGVTYCKVCHNSPHNDFLPAQLTMWQFSMGTAVLELDNHAFCIIEYSCDVWLKHVHVCMDACMLVEFWILWAFFVRQILELIRVWNVLNSIITFMNFIMYCSL